MSDTVIRRRGTLVCPIKRRKMLFIPQGEDQMRGSAHSRGVENGSNKTRMHAANCQVLDVLVSLVTHRMDQSIPK